MDILRVVGARQHNLKNVTCDIPRNRLVVITGPSGSGKSSLAFDTIYAEGQRRYVESLSAYARQFLDQLPRPDVDSIDGLSPAIAIEQKALASNPRSTVGTVTEVADYLRVLFANVGVAHCPRSGRPLHTHTVQEIVDELLALPEKTRFIVLAPLGRSLAGDLSFELSALRRQGYVRARIDGEYVELGDEILFDASREHTLEVVIDRLMVREGLRQRLTDSIELALARGNGTVLLDLLDRATPWVRSERLVSWEYGIELPPLEPRLFSFNSPHGACPACTGLGVSRSIDPERLIGNPDSSLRQGAIIAAKGAGAEIMERELTRIHRQLKVDLDTPWSKLTEAQQQRVLFGADMAASDESQRVGYPGLVVRLQALLDAAEGDEDGADDSSFNPSRDLLAYTKERVCPVCNGSRLRREASYVQVAGYGFAALCSEPLDGVLKKLDEIEAKLQGSAANVAAPLIDAIRSRIRFLLGVGLHYLSLDRAANTLSSGESQRIRLATQIGSALLGVLYVLDEPSVGLHPRDNANLLAALRTLVDKGNTVLVVEHDRELILAADYVLDLGPGAGEHGGRLVSSGTPAQIMNDPASVTGPYLARTKSVMAVEEQRLESGKSIDILGARAHNLDSIDVSFPLGCFTAVTGVSGSGKSSLVVDTLLDAARRAAAGARRIEGAFESIRGLHQIDKVVGIDQAPIGRTPRSNPATYSGIFAHLRELYATLPEARARGYKAGRFSFNVKGGRCEKCRGDGSLRVEMHFLPDMFVPCDACGGFRYNRETLEIRYRGKNIAESLALTVDEASEIFAAIPKLAQKLAPFRQLGLGYLRLGQPAPTLSGGEAQRLKLASELSRPALEHTLYVLDEPTSGLHFSDVELLLAALQALRDNGHTVIVIEHNTDLIACADWVIDLGPLGGTGGGRIVAQGSPTDIAASSSSHTGNALSEAMSRSPRSTATPSSKPSRRKRRKSAS